MRASISEVLEYRKCPRRWWFGRRWQSATTSPALITGTATHKEFQEFLNALSTEPGGVTLPDHRFPYISKVDDLQQLQAVLKDCKFLAVEKAFEWEFRGHTVLGRPDGVIEKNGKIYLWQIKTCSRNMASHIEYVRVSPHENVYAAAVSEFLGKPVIGTILCRYIKTHAPSMLIDTISIDKDLQDDVLDSLEITLEDMERFTSKDRIDVPAHTNNCVDWITGLKCQYQDVCQGRLPPEQLFQPTVTRYPEFDVDPE